MRFSTFLVAVFLATVAMPAMLLVSDLVAVALDLPAWLFKGFSLVVLVGLVDTLFHVDSMIRRNITITEGEG